MSKEENRFPFSKRKEGEGDRRSPRRSFSKSEDHSKSERPFAKRNRRDDERGSDNVRSRGDFKRPFDREDNEERSTHRIQSTKTEMFGNFADFYLGKDNRKEIHEEVEETSAFEKKPRRERPDQRRTSFKEETKENIFDEPKQDDQPLLPWQKKSFKKENIDFTRKVEKEESPKKKRIHKSISTEEGLQKTPKNSEPVSNVMRLNKFVAKCGICSRRKAAELVKAGEVKVNGVVELQPAYELKPKDVVEYNGQVIEKQEEMVYLLMNKPKDYITTLDDEKGRRTVMDLIEDKTDVRVFPVGRLDRNTTGLLLITNDGDLTKKLSHPSHRVQKFYHVVLDKPVSDVHIQEIKDGLSLEDGYAEVDAVGHVDDRPKNEVGIEIHIGKNRIVRRIFEHLGYTVEKLDRTYYGGLTKKDLPRGWSRALTHKEILMLKHFTGK